jgi:hypothetical protein
MKGSPPPGNLQRKILPLRLLLKALILFVIFSTLLSLYPDMNYDWFRVFMPKLEKFPYYVVYHNDSANHGFDLQNVFDIKSLLDSHVISAEIKPENQYRIIFIGDSTTYFGNIYPIVNQITCGSKNLRAYNLGYPGVSATKDFMILQEAMKYSPDLVVWSVTYSIEDNNQGFIQANPGQYKQLTNNYHLPVTGSTSALNWKTAFFQSDKLRLETYLLMNYSILAAATGDQSKIIQTALRDDVDSTQQAVVIAGHGGDAFLPIIQAFKKISRGVPILLINEPRPNVITTLSQYLQFGKRISSLTSINHIPFLDIGNLVPDKDFVDRVHRNKEGERLFDQAVIPAILKFACTPEP